MNFSNFGNRWALFSMVIDAGNTSSYQHIYYSAGRERIFNNLKHEMLNMKSLLIVNFENVKFEISMNSLIL